MLSTPKLIIAAVIIVVLAGGAWMAGLFGPGPLAVTPDIATTTPQQQTTPSDLPTGQSDASNEALAQDAAALDAQMSALSSDSASMDQSLSDKPIQQDY